MSSISFLQLQAEIRLYAKKMKEHGYGLNCVSQNLYVEVPTPDVTVGDRAFLKEIKVN